MPCSSCVLSPCREGRSGYGGPATPCLGDWRNTVGNLIEFVWLKKAYHSPQFTGICGENRGVRFHRIRDVKQCLFNSIPPRYSLLEFRRRSAVWPEEAAVAMLLVVRVAPVVGLGFDRMVILGFDYNFTNYKFKLIKTVEFQKSH